MKKRFKKVSAIVFALVLTMCIGTSALARTVTVNVRGKLSSKTWTMQLKVSGSQVSGYTTYDKSGVTRSVSVTGYYTGPGFSGTRSVTAGDGRTSGTASKKVTTLARNEFVRGSSYHRVNKLARTINAKRK